MTTERSELRIGDLIGGIELEARIGSGGFGVVYRGRDPRGTTVAVKVLTPEVQDDAELGARLMKEAALMAEIEADNVVRFHAAGRDGARIWLAMEYVPGGTLRDKLPRGRPIEVEQALRWARHIAEGCAELHEIRDAAGRPAVHRDLKPENVLLTRDGLAKVTDFGIAKFRTSLKSTSSNEAMGTPLYMAPEQMDGAAEIDVRADVFAVGVMLYEMLSGKRPAEAGHDRELTLMEKVTRSILQPVVPLPELNPDVPEYVWTIAERALQKRPEHRFASMRELADALLAALKRVRKARGKKPSFAEIKMPDAAAAAAAQGEPSGPEGVATGMDPAPPGTTPRDLLATATTQPAPRPGAGGATPTEEVAEERMSTLDASSRSVRLPRARGLFSLTVMAGGLAIGAAIGVLAFRAWTTLPSGALLQGAPASTADAAPPDPPPALGDAGPADAAADPPGTSARPIPDAAPQVAGSADPRQNTPGGQAGAAPGKKAPAGSSAPAKKCAGIVCNPDL